MSTVAVYEGTARHRRLHAASCASSRRGCSSPISTSTRCPVRSTGCRAGRPAAARSCTSGGATSSTDDRRPLGDAVRDLVEARLGRRPDGPVHLLAHLRTFGWLFNPAGRLLLLERRRPRARRARARGHQHAVGRTPLVRHRRPRRDTGARIVAKAMHVSPFLPDGRRLPTCRGPRPGDDVAPRHRRRARGRDDVRGRPRVAADACSTGATRSTILAALSRDAAARVARDLPPGRGAVRSRACPCTVIRPDPLRRSPHDPAESNGALRVVHRLLQHAAGRHARARRSRSDAHASANATISGRAHRSAPVSTCTTRACTSESCARAASGLGESYADGWWDTDDLTGVLRLALRSLQTISARRDALHRLATPLVDPMARLRRADLDRDARNVRAHYDLGNEFFQHVLDETMVYSCAIFDTSRHDARRGVEGQVRSAGPHARPVPRRSAARDRHRLGRLRAPCGRALRMPRDHDHDLAARSTSSRPDGSGPPGSSDRITRARPTTTATCAAPSTKRSRSR